MAGMMAGLIPSTLLVAVALVPALLAFALVGVRSLAPPQPLPVSAAAVEQIPAEWLPPLSEVVTLHLSLGVPVAPEEAPQPLYATHPLHRATIAWLLDMLLASRLAPGEISMPARSPSIQVAMRGGEAVGARLAYDCKPFTSEAGHGYTCRQAPGELILQTKQGRAVRVINPAVAAWLQGGWRGDLAVGPVVPDLAREEALGIAREIDPQAKWQASFSEEYAVEGQAEPEVRRAWLFEAEYPSGSKTRVVVDAQTGAILRVAYLEGL